jgi:peptidoglycan/xylan/chitin deacetylase (PgdA/CDA1 family)
MQRLGRPQAAPFAVFTFDDGYADNLTRALPIMERFNAPFTVYVTTGMITRTIDAWWFGLAALIRAREQIELPGFGRFNCWSRNEKSAPLQASRRQCTGISACWHAARAYCEQQHRLQRATPSSR